MATYSNGDEVNPLDAQGRLIVRLIELEQDILVASGGSGGGVAETVSGSTVSLSGSVVAGARSVLFITSSDFAGSIAGVTRGADESLSFSSQTGNSLSAIPYTRSAGSIDIYKIV